MPRHAGSEACKEQVQTGNVEPQSAGGREEDTDHLCREREEEEGE